MQGVSLSLPPSLPLFLPLNTTRRPPHTGIADMRMFLQAGPSSSGVILGAALDSRGVRKMNVTVARDTALTLDQLLAGSGVSKFNGLGDLARIANTEVAYVPRTSQATTECEYAGPAAECCSCIVPF